MRIFITIMALSISPNLFAQNAPYIPFKKGTEWEYYTYKNCKTQSVLKAKVLDVKISNGITVATVQADTYIKNKKKSRIQYEELMKDSTLLLSCCEHGKKEMEEEMADKKTKNDLKDLEIICNDSLREEFPLSLKPGDSLRNTYAKTIMKGSEQGMSLSIMIEKQKKQRRVVGRESITIKNQSFPNCLVIEYTEYIKVDFNMGGMRAGLGIPFPPTSRIIRYREYFYPVLGGVVKRESLDDKCDYTELVLKKYE